MKKAYTIIQIGYNRFVFPDTETALQAYRMISGSIPVESVYSELPDGRKGINWIRDDSLSIGLETVGASAVELEFTKEELQAQVDARKDVEADMKLIDITDAPREIEFHEHEPL
jgi:hypothetical protein